MQLIEHEQKGHKGAFFVEEEGRRVAELGYTMAGTKVIIDHTDVDDALRAPGPGESWSPRQWTGRARRICR
jgi:predicted GNAT family acetyltransferase